MNRRAACRALLALGLALGAGEVLAQRKPKPPAAWAELTPEQQQILAPLKADWESIEPERRRKWIGIAKRYPKMKPQAQQRVQKRMQAWAKLTPAQRRQARENYKRLAKDAKKKKALREQWAEYQRQRPDSEAPTREQ